MAEKAFQSGHKFTSSGQCMDKYCWVCHQSLNYETEFFCDECGRGLHHYCAKGNSLALWVKHVPKELRNSQEFTIHCFVCDHMALGESKYNESELPYLNKAISKAADKLVELDQKLEKVFTFDPTALPRYTIVVAKPIWLSKIQQHAQQGKYKSPEEFFYDIKTLQHNCLVFNGPGKFVGYAKQIYEMAFEEYTHILYCYECYIHDAGRQLEASSDQLKKDPFFLKPCLRPHGIVWADEGAGVYNLAKIQNYRDPDPLLSLGGYPTVSLAFFGSRVIRSNVKLTQCYVYSSSAPSCSKPITNIQEQIDNRKEFAIYKANIQNEQRRLNESSNGDANGESSSISILDDQLKSTIWSDLLFDASKNTKLSLDRLYLVKVSTYISNGTGLASSTDRAHLNLSHTVNTRKMPRPNYDENISFYGIEGKPSKQPPTSTNIKAKVAFNSNGGSAAAKSFTPATNISHNFAISARIPSNGCANTSRAEIPVNVNASKGNTGKRKLDNEVPTTILRADPSDEDTEVFWSECSERLGAPQKNDLISNNSSSLNDKHANINYENDMFELIELDDPVNEDLAPLVTMMNNLSQRAQEDVITLRSSRWCRVCFGPAPIHIGPKMDLCSIKCLEYFYYNSSLSHPIPS